MSAGGYIVVTAEFHPEGSQWVGTSLELGTSTCADTLQEASEYLKEAIELHLNALEDVGERNRFFKEHQIRLYKRKPRWQASRAYIPFDRDAFVQKRSVAVP